MRRLVPVIALLVLVAVAGCLSPGLDGSSTATDGNVSVEYVFESGGVPDELGSANVTVQIVFAESTADFSRNSCWRDTYLGPYKPTPTPIATPTGDCHRSQQVTINLTEPGGTYTLNETAPERFDAGHGLIVTDVGATYRNGTTVTAIKGIGGHRSNIVDGNADGRYAVEIGIEAAEAVRYDYQLVSETNEVTPDAGAR